VTRSAPPIADSASVRERSVKAGVAAPIPLLGNEEVPGQRGLDRSNRAYWEVLFEGTVSQLSERSVLTGPSDLSGVTHRRPERRNRAFWSLGRAPVRRLRQTVLR
jgi:hypothetical protein